jgi:hypothetical protein
MGESAQSTLGAASPTRRCEAWPSILGTPLGRRTVVTGQTWVLDDPTSTVLFATGVAPRLRSLQRAAPLFRTAIGCRSIDADSILAVEGRKERIARLWLG